MKVIGVIPARYGSTRFPAKVLADILGKPMIQHVWEGAKRSKLLNDLIIACDDERVREKAKSFGAKAVLTSSEHKSGSDRIIEAVSSLNFEIIINIQGDEPLVHPSMIDGLAKAMLDDKSCVMATVIKPLDDLKEIEDPNVVKAIVDHKGYAIYFSRSVIPYSRDKADVKNIGYYKHLGLYAYRKEFLMNFNNLPVSRLEKTEQLEQLRVVQAGYKIKTVETPYNTMAVDTADDLKRVEEYLKKVGSRG